MRGTKIKQISSFYNKSWDNLLIELYCNNKLSSLEISDKIKKETEISITTRFIQYALKKLGIIRNLSESRKLGISMGRVDYKHLQKPMKSIEYRRGISLALRYAIFKKDRFRCVICGRNSSETKLVVDHIKPVVKGGTNNISNLRTLCTACNHGKKIYEGEK